MLYDTLIEYYKNLLIIQYRTKNNAEETIKILIDILLANMLIISIRDGFNIDTAIGKQLDVLGNIAGTDRYYPGYSYEDEPFFCMTDYIETEEVFNEDILRYGLTDYSEIYPQGRFLTYLDMFPSTNELDDETFRKLIKLKIFLNNSNLSVSDIDNILYELFSNNIRVESTNNMNIDYWVTPEYYILTKIILRKKLLPKPGGVRIGGILIQKESIFSFGSYGLVPSSNYCGFTTYDTEPLGYFLQYSDIHAIA